jgi:hypothetical protein
MGAMFGFIFGAFDIEDQNIFRIQVLLMREESVCYPIGTLIGAVAAILNEHLRLTQNKYHFQRIFDENLDDENDNL